MFALMCPVASCWMDHLTYSTQFRWYGPPIELITLLYIYE